MERARRSGGRLTVAAWLVGILMAASGGADAEERFRFGTIDLTLAGGYSFDLQSRTGVEEVDGFQFLPHVGLFLSDEHGPPGLRGNFELIAEPTIVHLTTKSDSATAVGLSALGRWVFATDWVVRPYLEFGLGILAGQFDFRQTNCDVNYIIEGGPGLLWFVAPQLAINASFRVQHISNASSCTFNLGINSGLVTVGISYFFP